MSQAQITLANEPPFRLGRIEISPPTREARGPDFHEVLEPRVLEVLIVLAQAAGAVVGRDELVTRCWDGRSVSDAVINRIISRIRRLAEKDEGASFAIETIAKVGYRLKRVSGGEDQPAVATAESGAQPLSAVSSPGGAPRSRARLIAAGALAVAVLLAGAFLGRAVLEGGQGGELATGQGIPTNVARIAIAPFAVADGTAPEREAARLIGESVVLALTERAMNIASPADAAEIGTDDPLGAATRLGARFLLSGTVRETDGHLSAVVRLEDVASRTVLWEHVFTATSARRLSAQTSVQTAFLMNWMLAGLDERNGSLPQGALPIFVRLCAVFVSQGNYRENIRLGRTLIAAAPDFAPGYQMITMPLAYASTQEPPDEAAAYVVEAQETAARALSIAPQNGMPYVGLSMIVQPQSDFRTRERLLRTGRDLSPNAALLASVLAELLSTTGRTSEGDSLSYVAAVLDPLDPRLLARRADRLLQAGKAADAAALMDRTAEAWPDVGDVRYARLMAYAYSGNTDGVAALLGDPATRPAFIQQEHIPCWTVALQSIAGQTQDRNAALDAMRRCAAAGALSENWHTHAMAALGVVDDVFARMEQGTTFLSSVNPFYPEFAGIRRDKRFLQVLADRGLLAYWYASDRWPDFCADPGLQYDCKAEAGRLAQAMR